MAPFSARKFLKEQRSEVPPVTKADLTGKTVVIIGANAGLGFEATKHLATMNPGRIIMGCRSQQKGEAALSEIRSATGFSRIEVWIIDLNNFASVKAFGDKFDQEGGRLDILMANAGIHSPEKYETTKDGWVSVWQTNCISQSLLTYRLLPHMFKTAQEYSTTPRIVVTSSKMHFQSVIPKHKFVQDSATPLKTISSREYFQKSATYDKYCDSKLLNVLFVRDLQHRLLNSNIVVNAADPGFCISQLRSQDRGFGAFMNSMLEKVLAHTTEEGSRLIVHAAVGGVDEEMKGGFVSFNNVIEPSDFAISAEAAKMQDKIHNEFLELLPLVGSSKEALKQYLK